jgi:hypothetical protein
MKRLDLCMLAALLAAPAVALAAGAPAPVGPGQPAVIPPPKPASSTTAPEVAGKSIILCFSCGGRYPQKVGEKNLGGFNFVYEFGSGCGGSQRFISDNRPFFCAAR